VYKRQKKDEKFFRVPGGHLNVGETALDALKRECMEELQVELSNIKLLDVIENIFTYEGEQGHEIIFLYKVAITDKELMSKEGPFPFMEQDFDGNEHKMLAEWISINEISENKHTVYPPFNYKDYFSNRDN